MAIECAAAISAAKAKYQSEITATIKEESNSAITKCIKGTKIENIFCTSNNEPQDEANNDIASDNTELLMQSITSS
ncbi:MAG: hypothetical protein ACIPMY_05225 [Rickettsia endosymbiont of Pentastiridius leporinus]